MPRSTNINTYDAADRALVSLQFVTSLAAGSKFLRIDDEKEAKRTYFRILAVIRAARETGTPTEQLMSMNLGVRSPIGCVDEITNATYYTIEFYDRNGARANDPLAAFVAETCGGTIPTISTAPGLAGSPFEQAAPAPDDSPQNDQLALLAKLGYTQTP